MARGDDTRARSRTAPAGKPAKGPTKGGRKPSGKPAPKQASKPSAREKVGPQWLLVLIGALVVLALAAWGYYPVAKQQYITARERDLLAARLAAVEARNASMEDEIARLQTPEGVEDYARSQLGWTKPGENAVIVEGVEGTSTIGIQPRIDPRSIEITETPLTRLLDGIFGVDTSSAQ